MVAVLDVVITLGSELRPRPISLSSGEGFRLAGYLGGRGLLSVKLTPPPVSLDFLSGLLRLTGVVSLDSRGSPM